MPQALAGSAVGCWFGGILWAYGCVTNPSVGVLDQCEVSKGFLSLAVVFTVLWLVAVKVLNE